MRRLTGSIACGVLVILVASCVEIIRLSHTCVACRLTRVDNTCFGLTRSTYYENECSQWYSAHVEPSHAHVWERAGCRCARNVFGRPVWFGCREGHYPILLLIPSVQMEVYQHFQDPLEAKKLFESLTDEKTQDDRLDQDDENRGELTVRAIYEWKAEGFPANWAEWWTGFSTKHVDDHRKWLNRPHADNDMSFGEWQEQRKKPD